ncbi:cell division protein SepF [Arsenicicoccus piscis]|uniref:Cell division protein SepF n=1 Tax=Arsenicicoccus piscis TaxID=673954 RepID=A0ABQ6HKT7_9MICO|nr:cell division protein SepF [Arsenicicoccus piscis]MCH8627099.1 cell division protein SepF [Arsenicicoccus piscis]GMA18957.1 cell division protein SepF 2 [Arsenicicoccus piscis]
MAGALRKTMVYLGLADDEEHDGYDSYDAADRRATSEQGGSTGTHAETPRRHVHAVDDRSERGTHSSATERHAEVSHLPQRTPVARVVRDPEVGPLNRITTIHPRTYNEAKTIGESFREGTPVIMNLSEMADDDAKRLVDFAAGLVFGLSGSIERVTSKVFLLSPATVEVSTESADAPQAAKGFFNQS